MATGTLRRSLGLALLVSTVSVACEAPDDSASAGSSSTQRDSAGVSITQLASIEDVPLCTGADAPAAVIGTGASEQQQLYSVRAAARLSDGRIAILNAGTHEVRVFTEAGDFIESFGRFGAGPGEFQAAAHLSVLPGDTMWVSDFMPLTYEVFDADGSWVRHVSPDPPFGSSPSGGGVLSDGTMILVERDLSRLRDFIPGRLTAHRYTATGEFVDTIGVYETSGVGETTSSRRLIAPWFGSWMFVDAAGRHLLLADSRRPEVRLHSLPSLGLSRIIRWQAGDRTPTPQVVQRARENLRAEYLADGNVAAAEMYLDDARPVEESYPAFARAQLDRSGGVWVERYDPVLDDGTGVWVRFSEDGLPGCEIELPADGFVWEFGANHALVGRRGELDVERVELYRWDRPGDVP